MQNDSGWYERLHKEDVSYGRNVYDVGALVRSSAVNRWLSRNDKSRLRILDIGCGKGQFLLDVTNTLRSEHKADFSRVAAVDLVRAANDRLGEIQPRPEFFQQSVDGNALPFPENSFDFVSCNHVLEHLFQTEKFVREIRRVLGANGLAVISVPNIAALINRIAFLFSGQPLGSEVGTESITYGFWPPFLQEKLKKFHPSGHIRDFTPRSLRDLTGVCGFQFAGWWAQNGGLIATWQRNIGIVLEPAPAGTR
jgi:SAM-dependent methyltransferase